MPSTATPPAETTTAEVHVLGIRHHGPGSARSLRRALEELRPDAVLVEGPPDADGLLPLLAHEQMRPPVALLVYAEERPSAAAYYPFAVFSPEWQAIHYALTQNIPVRFMDLPQTHQLLPEEPPTPTADHALSPSAEVGPNGDGEAGDGEAEDGDDEAALALLFEPRRDPLRWLAEAAGFSDGERWWEHMVEHRRDGTDLFAAILEAMTALREELPPNLDPREDRREAFMRQAIRKAQGEGHRRIAVVCGAWHAPALAKMPPAKDDAEILKGLPKNKVNATWVPWTYGRLTAASGYGAGIESPGWYHHLWDAPPPVVARWVTRVARLLREEDLDASAAHVIEAVRLAESLAALRDRPLPGLPELNEAVQAVLCHGDATPMRLIHHKLIVGETLGAVPDETPMVPLQRDLAREQSRLRLPPDASQKVEDFDLRKPNDLERSHLLHRLALLNIPWGVVQAVSGKSGTFHEVWRLQWQPEFAVALIEAGVWGNTILAAATARARDLADRAADLPALTELLEKALLAELPDAVAHLMRRLESEAALASDVTHLMGALPPLANVLRYGDVRKTDTAMIGHAVDGLVARVCINLPVACGSLDDDAAAAMFDHILKADAAIALLQDDAHRASWHDALRRLADRASVHPLVQGRCVRLLLDAGALPPDDASRRLSLALSVATDPGQAGAWVEGLLKGSGLILLHDDALWDVLDGWVSSLPGDVFTPALPLIRRTFSTFPAPERRQMGERARRGRARARADGSAPSAPAGFDTARADAVLPMLGRLFGIPIGPPPDASGPTP
jgi:hypothetical protein